MTAPTSVLVRVPRCGGFAGECHVCGDVAEVGRVVEIDAAARTATVAFGAAAATVALDLVEVRVDDEVIVHLGFAIERVGER